MLKQGINRDEDRNGLCPRELGDRWEDTDIYEGKHNRVINAMRGGYKGLLDLIQMVMDGTV